MDFAGIIQKANDSLRKAIVEKEKLRYRVRFACPCGAKLACRTRIVGRTTRCPECGNSFEVPHPAPPPNGPLWLVHHQLTPEEYSQQEEALVDYSVAIQAQQNSPDLFWHINETLAIIKQFRSPDNRLGADMPSPSPPVAVFESALNKNSFGGIG